MLELHAINNERLRYNTTNKQYQTKFEPVMRIGNQLH